MKNSLYRLLSACIPLLCFVCIYTQQLHAEEAIHSGYSTSVEGHVFQKHDRTDIKDAAVVLTVSGKVYKARTNSRGTFEIHDIALGSPVANRGTVEVIYKDVVLYHKKTYLLNVPKKYIDIAVTGDLRKPNPPRLDFTYFATNEQAKELKGRKDPYSSIYVNGIRVTLGTIAKDWKAQYGLNEGLNTLFITARNILGVESRPVILHITYFPKTEGTRTYHSGPANVRVNKHEQSNVVSWQFVSDNNVTGYNVYRSSTSGGPYEKINDAPVGGNVFIDEDTGSKDCFYVVTAVWPDVEGDFSNEISAATEERGGTDVPDSISKDTTLTLEKSPYLVSTEVIVDETATLTIEPGVEVRFKKGKTGLNGRIIAQGSESQQIIFTSGQSNAGPGYWQGINAEDGSVFSNCGVEYGGRNGYDALSLSGTSSVSDSVITHNAYNGVGIRSKSSNVKVLVSGNAISNNGKNGILIKDTNDKAKTTIYNTSVIKNNKIKDNNGCGIVTKIEEKGGEVRDFTDILENEIEHNGSYGIIADAENNVNENKISENGYSDAVVIEGNEIARDVTWDRGQYVVSSLVISDDSKLTLEPGVIVKATENAMITGKIEARGTDDEAVIFTSYVDDSHGGDVNVDGLVKKAAGGDWKGLRLRDGSRLINCEINYASGGGGGIFLDGEDIELVNVESYFIRDKIGLFNISKLISRTAGENDKKSRPWLKRLSAEIILVLSIGIPFGIFVFVLIMFRNRRSRIKQENVKRD